ncbi:oxygenase MpaB family protein [Nocardia sp. NPDC051833]|uniref:oxygenase MpaB family protein n=1 Tax=Nocardia sp. NPDC051833 TaxID=3155674 RepID=UPI00344035E0
MTTVPHSPDTEIETHFVFDAHDAPVDHGLFGPDSISWKVWSHPAALVGGIRSFQAEILTSPEAAAAVVDFGTYKDDPVGRLQRTMQYFLTIVFGDTATVDKANLRLGRMHKRITGHTPATGRAYSGVDPLLMLGTHLLTWHSVWVCYEALVGKQSKEDEERYFLESERAARALGLDQLSAEEYRALAAERGYDITAIENFEGAAPATHADYSAFLSTTEPAWTVTGQTRAVIDALMKPDGASSLREALLYSFYPLISNAAAATLPRKMRAIAGIPTSSAWEVRSIALGKLAMSALSIPQTRIRFENEVSARGYALVRKAMAQA